MLQYSSSASPDVKLQIFNYLYNDLRLFHLQVCLEGAISKETVQAQLSRGQRAAGKPFFNLRTF